MCRSRPSSSAATAPGPGRRGAGRASAATARAVQGAGRLRPPRGAPADRRAASSGARSSGRDARSGRQGPRARTDVERPDGAHHRVPDRRRRPRPRAAPPRHAVHRRPARRSGPPPGRHRATSPSTRSTGGGAATAVWPTRRPSTSRSTSTTSRRSSTPRDVHAAALVGISYGASSPWSSPPGGPDRCPRRRRLRAAVRTARRRRHAGDLRDGRRGHGTGVRDGRCAGRCRGIHDAASPAAIGLGSPPGSRPRRSSRPRVAAPTPMPRLRGLRPRRPRTGSRLPSRS